jgi:nitrous oxide reductase accessory protein NosL
MRRSVFSVLVLSVLVAGCMTTEQQRAADEERCRSYGFKH